MQIFSTWYLDTCFTSLFNYSLRLGLLGETGLNIPQATGAGILHISTSASCPMPTMKK